MNQVSRSKVRVWADLHKIPVRTIFLSSYPKLVHTSAIKCTWINDVQWLSTMFLGQRLRSHKIYLKNLCQNHIFSSFGPIWLVLHIKSACCEHEPSFQVNGECHSRSLKKFWTIFSLSLVKSSSDVTNDCPQVREWSAVTLNHAFMERSQRRTLNTLSLSEAKVYSLQSYMPHTAPVECLLKIYRICRDLELNF